MILDLGLPDLDGVEIVRRLREWTAIPIIVLSARAMESAKIATLDEGADDYLAKPFGMGELLARIRVALRHAARNSNNEHGEFITGDLKVDLIRRRVIVDNQEIHLTPIEYRLLGVLIKNAGKVMTHRQLLREVWVRPIARTIIMSVSTWHSCGVSWRRIRRNPASCSRKQVWAIDYLILEGAPLHEVGALSYSTNTIQPGLAGRGGGTTAASAHRHAGDLLPAYAWAPLPA